MSAARSIDATNLAERLSGVQREFWVHVEAKGSLEKYPAKQHARRVAEKLGVQDGLVYLPGSQSRNNEDSDMPAKYRQRRYFYYLSGCNEPDCHLTYDVQNDTLTLFIPRVNPERVIWNGRGSTKIEAQEKYDVDRVHYIDDLQHFVLNWTKYFHGLIYILHQKQALFIPGLHDSFDWATLQPAMNLARLVKDEHEIKLIKKANDISSLAHREVLANILRFTNEAQVEGLFLDVCISKQAKEQAYDPIAASGPNAGTLHYDSNNEDFGDRQLMCLDAGCEYDLYASDITRTFPLSGSWPSVEARNIYRLVERMQETCIRKLAPGVRYLDLHILAHQIAIDGLLSLGILHNGSKEEIYKAGTSRAFFPHGLGHHVGLEVHDVGQADLMSIMKGNPKYEKAPSVYAENFHVPIYDEKLCMAPADPQSGHLEEGMVVTVEPGIYFSAYALTNFYIPSPIHSKYINESVLKKYYPVGGVRIEDDILITSKGYKNLTTAPKGESMLQIIRSQNAHFPLAPQFVGFGTDLGTTQRERKNTRELSDSEDEPFRRAPGIARNTPKPTHMPLSRVQSAPIEADSRRDDFEPYAGPSLFAGFKKASTFDVAANHKSQKQGQQSAKAKIRIPICGEDSPAFEHTYIDQPGTSSASNNTLEKSKPACKSCTILLQTLGRLRQTLTKSEQSSPVMESKSTLEPFPQTREGETRTAATTQASNPSMKSTANIVSGSWQSDAKDPTKVHPRAQLTQSEKIRRAATMPVVYPPQPRHQTSTETFLPQKNPTHATRRLNQSTSISNLGAGGAWFSDRKEPAIMPAPRSSNTKPVAMMSFDEGNKYIQAHSTASWAAPKDSLNPTTFPHTRPSIPDHRPSRSNNPYAPTKRHTIAETSTSSMPFAHPVSVPRNSQPHQVPMSRPQLVQQKLPHPSVPATQPLPPQRKPALDQQIDDLERAMHRLRTMKSTLQRQSQNQTHGLPAEEQFEEKNNWERSI